MVGPLGPRRRRKSLAAHSMAHVAIQCYVLTDSIIFTYWFNYIQIMFNFQYEDVKLWRAPAPRWTG